MKEGEADGRFKEKEYGAQHETDGSGKRKREERASGAGKKVRIGGPTRVDIVRGVRMSAGATLGRREQR